MLIERIDHVQLAMPVGAEERAREFYQGVLGIPEVPKPPHMAKRGGCWFERGELKVHLGADANFQAARKAHPAFSVAGLRSLTERLTDLGYTVRDDEAVYGRARVQLDDPFGNRIELIEARAGE
jgi:catechol 2,3-dioxygenase-like lactoylglutathione lyase family enzyme